MSAFFGWLATWLQGLLPWVWSVVKSIFKPFWDMFYDLICFVVEEVLGFAVAMVEKISVPAWDLNATLSGAPAELLGMMSMIGIPEALGIITTALGIRFALQLIPFVRLGS